jgi:hypothetical protein
VRAVPLAEDISVAVDAARKADADGFREAVADLSTVDQPVLTKLLGWVVRSLLEDVHPDGLDSEDLQAVLLGCVTAARPFDFDADPSALLVVLTGALGLSDPDEQPEVTPAAVAGNAVLLLAYLLGKRPLGPYLDAALAELRRAETIEMP